MAPKQRKFVPKRKWLFPMGVEREYQRFMKRFTQAMLDAVKEELSRIHSLAVNSALKNDGISEDVLSIMQDIKKRFNGKITAAQMQAELKKVAQQAENFNAQQFRAVMRSSVQVDIFLHEPWLNELADVWTGENVRLIKTIPEKFYGEVEGVVSRGMMDGTLTNKVGEQIQQVYGVADRRAQLIARDQIGKLNGDLTMHRQTGVGIESYKWSTSNDERVRDEHADREGQEFKWSDPPEDGHPGKAIYCRCVALPVIDLNKINYAGIPGGR